jgi:hypothetical protein
LDCQGCPLAELELLPANREAWEAYQLVADQWRPTWTGMGPLDMRAVIVVLRALGRWPGGMEEREEMLLKLRTIHEVRMEVLQQTAKNDPRADHRHRADRR